MSGLILSSLVGPLELKLSRASVLWNVAPTVKEPVASAGIEILPSETLCAAVKS